MRRPHTGHHSRAYTARRYESQMSHGVCAGREQEEEAQSKGAGMPSSNRWFNSCLPGHFHSRGPDKTRHQPRSHKQGLEAAGGDMYKQMVNA